MTTCMGAHQPWPSGDPNLGRRAADTADLDLPRPVFERLLKQFIPIPLLESQNVTIYRTFLWYTIVRHISGIRLSLCVPSMS